MVLSLLTCGLFNLLEESEDGGQFLSQGFLRKHAHTAHSGAGECARERAVTQTTFLVGVGQRSFADFINFLTFSFSRFAFRKRGERGSADESLTVH